MSPFTKLTSTAAIGSFLVLGCPFTEDNPDHCGNNDGDAYCVRHFTDGALPYCEAGTKGCITAGHERYGCLAERPADACYSPCGGGRTQADDGECPPDSDTIEVTTSPSTTYASTASDTATTNPSADSTTGSMPCTVDEDCAEPMPPFCDATSGGCVTCDAFGASADARCAALDPTSPLCVDGMCVPCTPENPAACDDQRLLCDGATNTCVPCTEHEQCSSGACELKVGLCFPQDAIRLEVDGDGPADYPSISLAVNAVDDGAHGVIVVRELDGGAYYGPAIVTNAKTIALLAAPGELPIIQGIIGSPGLRASGNGTSLYLDRISMSGNTMGIGLLVDLEALAWVDRSHIVQNSDGGILVQNSAELTLRNSFIGSNIDTDALFVQDATVDVLYSTLGANYCISRALKCEGISIVTVRNSLLVSLDVADEVQCPGVMARHTATEMSLGGEGNVELGDVQTGWFVSYNSGNFHLMNPLLALTTAAQWEDGDPSTDIDGTLRPRRDGTDFVGADVP